jgi:hypothetical protein
MVELTDLALCVKKLLRKWVDDRRSGRQMGKSVVCSKGEHWLLMEDGEWIKKSYST